MPLSISIANREEADIVRRLGQLYLHELCRSSHQELQDDGTFAFPQLEACFTEGDRYAYIVRLRGKVAGFAVVKARETTTDHPYHEISDLFVVETYRRFGLGEEVARVLFERHEGLWRVTARDGHEVARTFWRKVIRRYALKTVREFPSPDVDGIVFEFTAPPPLKMVQHESVLDRSVLKVSAKQPG